jgi:hypothetical protein
MELKNVKQIENLAKNGVKLYLICPIVSTTGKILRNKVYDVVNCCNFRYATSLMTKPTDEFVIFRKQGTWRGYEDVKDTDEINTKARVFASKEDATKALEDEIKLLSYEAIKRIDYQLKSIERSRERLNKKEEKFLALKQQHYETSVKRFSK